MPLLNQLTTEESLRVGVQGSRAEIELVPGAIQSLWREWNELSKHPVNAGATLPLEVLRTVDAGENAGITDALLCLDALYEAVRRLSDKKNAAEAEKVRF